MIATSLSFLLLLVQCTAVEHNLINPDQSVLLLSTLNGSLIAVDKLTGMEMWTLDKDPILEVSSADSMEFNFFPNPKDGSIYALRDGDQLERLALSIPNLVEISPTQSSDGLLYAGRKSDSWFAVDSLTGRQLHSFTSDGIATTCPLPESRGNVIHIARTAYTITVHDRKSSSQRWNATYMEYASSSYKEPAESDLLHFCSNSDGLVLSVDRLTGQEVWRQQFSSPVMGVYAVEEGSLRKVPSTSVASDTLSMLTGSSILAIRTDTFGIKASDSALQLSLFIGMYQGQLYAVNSLVKDTDLKLEINSPLLLEGPQASNSKGKVARESDEDKSPKDVPQFLEAGHYCLPEEGKVSFTPMQIEKEFLALLQGKTSESEVGEPITDAQDGYSSPAVEYLAPPQPSSPADYNMPSRRMENILVPVLTVLTSAVLASVIAVLVTKFSGKQPQLVMPPDGSSHLSTESLNLSTSSSLGGSVDGGSGSGGTRTVAAETPSSTTTTVRNGEVTVGKITYYSGEILGYGSEGTIVFKGKFDERPVAVKRLLPECFGFADREVDLLRQSDKHANVVRYYSMEQDSSFRYIALELCQATLREYVEDKENRFGQSKKLSLDILHQALKGLTYLHSIGIVHRDIKPHNVLLASTMSNGSILRAMISDFGLCKKLAHGKVSFTARSGLTGTEGWMAPEILQKNGRVTFAVDIFSMGCVVYYMLTAGNHPFGPPLRRQANIESDDYSLQALTGVDQCVASELLKNMISHNSNFRPRAEEVLVHCLFWSEERQLAFFQDVSDRIEKESYMSPVVQALELGASNVCRGDWRNNISDELKEDLRKFRSYQGSSVRDLLRAMRNKKHHYRELPEELKLSLGSIPDEFLRYFTSRFPMLLIHTYRKMETCKHERVFKKYYSTEI